MEGSGDKGTDIFRHTTLPIRRIRNSVFQDSNVRSRLKILEILEFGTKVIDYYGWGISIVLLIYSTTRTFVNPFIFRIFSQSLFSNLLRPRSRPYFGTLVNIFTCFDTVCNNRPTKQEFQFIVPSAPVICSEERTEENPWSRLLEGRILPDPRFFYFVSTNRPGDQLLLVRPSWQNLLGISLADCQNK